ncbi:hypothetical protein NUM3379_17930 [Kineococcus sp. NUM-3379]
MTRRSRVPRRSAAALSTPRTAAAGGVILVLRFATGSVLNYALGVLVAWLLVPEEFGVVGASQNVLLFAAGALTAGLPWALTVRMAAADTGPAEVSRILRTSLVGNLVLGVLLALALVLAQTGGLRIVPTASGALVAVLAVEIVVLALNAVLGGALQATRRFAGLGAMHSVEILVKCLVATFLVVFLDAGALGVAIGFLVGSLVATAIALRALTGVLPGWGPLAPLRSVSMAAPIWVGTVSFTAVLTVDLLGLSYLTGGGAAAAASLAAYQVCSLLARAPYFVSDALVDAVFPFMAAARDDGRGVHAWFVEAVRWIPVALLPLQLVLLIAPGPVLRLLFPEHYAPSEAVLRLLTLGTLGLMLANALVKTAYAVQEPRGIARVMPWAVLVELVGLAVLVPSHGATGAAAAYAVACWVAVAVLGRAYLRRQGRLAREGVGPRLAGRFLLCLAPSTAVLLVAANAGDGLALGLFAVAGLVHLASARAWGFVRDRDVARVHPSLVAVGRRGARHPAR